MRILFTPTAKRDIADARNWYRRQDERVARRFVSEVDARLKTIANNPQVFPLVYKDLRRALLKRFPYSILFRVADDEIVVGARLKLVTRRCALRAENYLPSTAIPSSIAHFGSERAS